MDCRKFSDQLGDLKEGVLAPDERRAMEEHLRTCDHCRKLQAMVSEEPGDWKVAVPADLTESILSHTTGPVCASAHERLCDHVDRVLDSAGGELVSLHLQGCVECAGLFGALSSLRVDLPALAELDPDPGFVGDVLARTRPRRRSGSTWIERWAEEWRSLIERPRFAWEGAYVGAFLLMLIFGTSNAPLASVPQKGMQVSSSVGSVWEMTRNNLIDTSTELAVDVRRRSSAVLEAARESLRTARETLEAARESLRTAREDLETAREDFGTAREDFGTAREDFGTARESLGTAREGLGTARESLGTARESLGTAREELGTARERLPLMQEKDDTNRPADGSGPDEGEKP